MSEFYDEIPGKYPSELPPLGEGEIRGDWWSAIPKDGRYIFEYISGELAGRLKTIVISENEYHNLVNGRMTSDDVLRAYGAH